MVYLFNLHFTLHFFISYIIFLHSQVINHKNSLSFDPSSINDVDQPMCSSIDEDKRTLTSAAIGRITPSPMDEDLTLMQTNLDNSIDDLPVLRPFEDSLMDSLDSDSKLPIDEEMESVMKPDLDMFDSNSGLPESPPTSDHMNEHKLMSASSFRSLNFTPPKTGGKRKLGPKLKVRIDRNPAAPLGANIQTQHLSTICVLSSYLVLFE